MSDDASTELGEPFQSVERSAVDTLASLGAYPIAVNDPPWSSIAARVPAPRGAYRRVGAACAALGHSRFEEGSEHCWAYAYEHATGAHHVHGELICFAVVALAHVQDNDPEFAHGVVSRAGVRANPGDLGIGRDEFVHALVSLRAYSRDEGLDVGIAELTDITAHDANQAYDFAATLPRVPNPNF